VEHDGEKMKTNPVKDAPATHSEATTQVQALSLKLKKPRAMKKDLIKQPKRFKSKVYAYVGTMSLLSPEKDEMMEMQGAKHTRGSELLEAAKENCDLNGNYRITRKTYVEMTSKLA
jgi:hypothetical protein